MSDYNTTQPPEVNEHLLMAEWSALKITDAGIALRQRAIANGERIRFTRAWIGTGKPAADQSPYTITAPIEPVMEMKVRSSLHKDEHHWIIILIDNRDMDKEIFMREATIHAEIVDSGESEIVYGYAYAEHGAEAIPSGKGQHRIWEMYFNTRISRSEQVEILYDGSIIYATRDDIEQIHPTERVAVIEHRLGRYPHCVELYHTRHALGVGGLGEGPLGGEKLTSIPVQSELDDIHKISILVPRHYAQAEGLEVVPQHKPDEETKAYSLLYPEGPDSLYLMMR